MGGASDHPGQANSTESNTTDSVVSVVAKASPIKLGPQTLLTLSMTGFFQVSRLTLRAVLVASLLVLGHFLLISAPTLGSTPELASNLKATSAILFHTLLWTVFVLFEEVDLGRLSSREIEECGYLFVCTGCELLLNSIFVGAWFAWSEDSTALIQTIISEQFSRLWMIPLSYGLALVTIFLLQIQLLGSIIRHMVNRGPSEVFRVSFWKERAGHWEERILLEDEEDVMLPIEKA